jgi:hypothetical protein
MITGGDPYAPLDQPVELIIDTCREHSMNVKRWRNGTMALRWCAAGMLEADHQFRSVNGHLQPPKLCTRRNSAPRSTRTSLGMSVP